MNNIVVVVADQQLLTTHISPCPMMSYNGTPRGSINWDDSLIGHTWSIRANDTQHRTLSNNLTSMIVSFSNCCIWHKTVTELSFFAVFGGRASKHIYTVDGSHFFNDRNFFNDPPYTYKTNWSPVERRHQSKASSHPRSAWRRTTDLSCSSSSVYNCCDRSPGLLMAEYGLPSLDRDGSTNSSAASIASVGDGDFSRDLKVRSWLSSLEGECLTCSDGHRCTHR